MTLVHTLLESSFDKDAEKQSVWFKDKWYSYRDLEESANKVANFLIQTGIKKGDRVAILLENSFNYIVSYYGILKTGAVTVGLNTETTPSSIEYLLENSGSRVLISDKPFKKYLNPIKETLDKLESVVFLTIPNGFEESSNVVEIESIYKNYPAQRPNIRIINIDLAAIVYTSGSTGVPKGVTLSHLNIATNTASIISYLQLNAQDRIMVVLPFYYIYGLSLLNTHISVGGSIVIDNRFAFPNAVLDTMEKQKTTGFAGVPSTFSILLNKSNLKSKNFESLRYITQAGGAMAPSVQKDVAKIFNPAKLFVMYGATEASARLSYLDPEFLPYKFGSIGKAIPNVDLFVADADGNPLPQGSKGEIVARGANIMQGYWKDQNETDMVLKNGLYFTGDIGQVDEDGFIFIVGRSKDMIKVGANRISAKEIEEAIIENENVIEVAVIGLPDELLGEIMDACVVLKNEDQEWQEKLLKHTKSKLPSFKVPAIFTRMDSLPKNSSGKVMKNKIKELRGL
ncbi:MAG: AMP-dependent synthetase [Calditrichaeota bacterium]|nr:MAG: AMP-dependent synthetase [Calditrichota bacterium]MBL1206357.1 AMP-dependent synthetase [Calditrichota bacterium]NOG46183.1 AMP-binding protein [Calditrichota bacterium]